MSRRRRERLERRLRACGLRRPAIEKVEALLIAFSTRERPLSLQQAARIVARVVRR